MYSTVLQSTKYSTLYITESVGSRCINRKTTVSQENPCFVKIHSPATCCKIPHSEPGTFFEKRFSNCLGAPKKYVEYGGIWAGFYRFYFGCFASNSEIIDCIRGAYMSHSHVCCLMFEFLIKSKYLSFNSWQAQVWRVMCQWSLQFHSLCLPGWVHMQIHMYDISHLFQRNQAGTLVLYPFTMEIQNHQKNVA